MHMLPNMDPVAISVGLIVGILIGWLIGRWKGRPVLGAVLGILGIIGWIIIAVIPRPADSTA